jgi:phosphoglycolate phosphatase
MMLSNILFDLDGTLTDPKEGITRCIQFALDQLGAKPPEAGQLDWCIGPPLRNSFSQLLSTEDDALIEKAVSHYRKRFSEIGMFENMVYPGVMSSLRRIKTAGIRVFLATSKPKVFAQQILDYFNLTPFFDAVYGSELNGRLSDKGELVAHILHTEGLESKLTLIVGDRSHDILGGKKNGILTAAVSYGYGSQEEITSAKPDYTFDTFSALADLIE